MKRDVSIEGGNCSRCDEHGVIVRWFDNGTPNEDQRGLCAYCLAIVIQIAAEDSFFLEEIERERRRWEERGGT